jgi:Spy/CpxP family protein refolding chaperone
MRRVLLLAIPFALAVGFTASQLVSQETSARPAAKDAAADKLPPGAERTSTGKIVYRGRLPNGWSKLGILADQKQKIYKVQAEYNAQIEELERQIEELKAQRDVAMREQLTEEQQAQLDELTGAKSTAGESE